MLPALRAQPSWAGASYRAQGAPTFGGVRAGVAIKKHHGENRRTRYLMCLSS